MDNVRGTRVPFEIFLFFLVLTFLNSKFGLQGPSPGYYSFHSSDLKDDFLVGEREAPALSDREAEPFSLF